MRLPYARVEFDTQGRIARPEQRDAVGAMVRESEPTSLLLLSHGWNNDLLQAERLYTTLGDRLEELREARGLPDRVGVVGLFWPSISWADPDTVAGGGLSAADPREQLVDRIAASVEDPDAAVALRAAADALDTPEGRAAFVRTVQERLLPAPGRVDDDDALPHSLRQGGPDELLDRVSDGLLAAVAAAPPPVDGTGAATGFDLSAFNPFTIARALVNTASYFTMKDRAGTVGSVGVTQLLRDLREVRPDLSLDLAGHSFGARVVTAAAAATDVPVHSVTLLQGAFSQLALTSGNGPMGHEGAFRRAVVAGVEGPIVVTHTHNDRAVRIAYAIASRIAQQQGSGLGDASDPYGGIGANGAVGMDAGEADGSAPLGGVGVAYDFTGAKVHNLRADEFVSGHSAVDGPEVANALLAAIRS